MLEYLDMYEAAERMQKAMEAALSSPETRTKDLGGSAGTKEFTQAIIENLE
jgi:isocitrate/isopropylmalate dehydrogenase